MVEETQHPIERQRALAKQPLTLSMSSLSRSVFSFGSSGLK